MKAGPLTIEEIDAMLHHPAPKRRNPVRDALRMTGWLLTGIVLYWLSAAVGPEHPATQTVLYKLGHVTTLAWVGYWIARNAIGRLRDSSTPGERMARAIVIAGVVIAGSLGL